MGVSNGLDFDTILERMTRLYDGYHFYLHCEGGESFQCVECMQVEDFGQFLVSDRHSYLSGEFVERK